MPIPEVSAAGFGMQERIHKRITIIHKLLGNKKYPEALERLATLSNTVKNLPYEKGVVLQLYGYVYSQKGEPARAIEYFTQCLQLNSLPKDSLQNVRMNIIQLHLDRKQYPQAETMFRQWKSNQPLSADGYALGGVVYALLKKYKLAETELSRAIQLASPAKEEWLQALLSIYLDSKRYAKAAELLEKLVSVSPDKKQYWFQLADVSYMLKRYKKAASVMEVAYQKKYFTISSEYKKLAAFHYYNNAPYKAAGVLEAALETKMLVENTEHLRLIANYYIQARETDRAITWLSRAAAKSQDPALQYTIAQLHFEKQNWQKAQTAIKPLLQIKDSELKDRASLMSGIISFELKKFAPAIQAFDAIAYESELYAEAQSWKQYVNGMMKAEY